MTWAENYLRQQYPRDISQIMYLFGYNEIAYAMDA